MNDLVGFVFGPPSYCCEWCRPFAEIWYQTVEALHEHQQLEHPKEWAARPRGTITITSIRPTK